MDEESRTLTIYRQTEAAIIDDGILYRFPVQSYQMSVDSILATAVSDFGLTPVTEDDLVSYDKEQNRIQIRRALQVTLTTEDGTEQVLMHNGDTVSALLKQERVILGEHDILKPALHTVLTEGMQVEVQPRVEIEVTADGATESHIVAAGTVSSALRETGYELGDEDTANYEMTDEIFNGMSIEIGRVTYREVTEEREIDYKVIEKESDSLYIGEVEIETYGQMGIQTIVTKEKLLNGEVVSSEELSNEVTQEPVDEVVLIGTKEEEEIISWDDSIEADTTGSTLIDHNGKKVSYSSVLTGSCSAYTGGGITASGLPAAVGNVAVNPNVIPYGTRLYICSPDGSFVYGYATAADTGGAFLYGGYLADLYYDTVDECYSFGIRTMNVYILD